MPIPSIRKVLSAIPTLRGRESYKSLDSSGQVPSKTIEPKTPGSEFSKSRLSTIKSNIQMFAQSLIARLLK